MALSSWGCPAAIRSSPKQRGGQSEGYSGHTRDLAVSVQCVVSCCLGRVNDVELQSSKTLRVLRPIGLSGGQLEFPLHCLILFLLSHMFKVVLDVPSVTCCVLTGLLQAQNLLTQLPQQSQANLLQSQPGIALTSQVSLLPGCRHPGPAVRRDFGTLFNQNTLLQTTQHPN